MPSLADKTLADSVNASAAKYGLNRPITRRQVQLAKNFKKVVGNKAHYTPLVYQGPFSLLAPSRYVDDEIKKSLSANGLKSSQFTRNLIAQNGQEDAGAALLAAKRRSGGFIDNLNIPAFARNYLQSNSPKTLGGAINALGTSQGYQNAYKNNGYLGMLGQWAKTHKGYLAAGAGLSGGALLLGSALFGGRRAAPAPYVGGYLRRLPAANPYYARLKASRF